LEHTRASTHYSEAPLEIAKEAVWRFSNCKRVTPVKTKRMTVVFTSLGFRGLFVPLFYGLNGDLVNRKLSLLTDKLNEPIIDERLTIVDDATVRGLPGSCPIDDEGVISKRKILVDNGTLKNYLYDLRSASVAGVSSTGNGFKKSSLYTGFSIDAPPNPYPSNLIINAGEKTRDEIIKSIKDGIIVDDTMGAGQGNNLNGEFSMSIALGYRILNGEIIGRVKDIMVAGNVFDILKNNFSQASKEVWIEDTLFGKYSVPWLVFNDMLVSAT
jgi:PmbA protein